MIMNSGLTFIKSHPFLSISIAVITLYIISLIPSDIWWLLFFAFLFGGQIRR